MLNWRKLIPVLVIALSILAFGAIAFSDISPEQEKAEAQAQENALRSTATQAPISADLAAKWAMEEEIAAKIAAEEEGEAEAVVTKEAYATRDNHKGVANIAGHPITRYNPGSIYFSEDFEAEDMPPVGWDTVNTDPGYGFFLGTYSGGGTQAALVTWHAAGYIQDEWMISPTADLTSATSDIRCEFWFLKGYSYPHEFKVYVATDGVTFNLVWDSDVEGAGYPEFAWTQATIDMSAYIGQSVTLGFQYYGEDADLFGLDDVVLTDDAAATGRCCYGPDPFNPTCEDDVTLEYCTGVGGSWMDGGNCVDNPCPIPDENDECTGATVQALPYTFMGNNEAATYDTYCQYFGDYPNVWIAFEITECMDITLTYCGSPDGWGNGWLNLITDCACSEGSLISGATYDFDCANGNPRIYFDHLGAGTYYYPVMLDASSGAAGDYVIEVTGVACPPITPGDACEDPFVVNIGSGDLPYTIANQYTCGRQDYYNETCLGSYDGGEDLIVQLNLADDMDVKITLDPKGLTYTGIAISNGCPDDGGTCIGSSTNSGSDPHTIQALSLTAGSYFIIVDTWPTPDCIPDLDIIIEEMGETQEGDNCLSPIKVDLPGFTSDLGQTTCGRIDDYNATCMGYYDGGEDIIYEITVASAMTVNFTLDPKGTTYSGMGLFNSCPSDDDCIDYETGYSSDPKRMTCVSLDPGVYYLMVDTWPSPDCIPEFDLFITDTTCEALENDDCADAIAINEVMDLPFSTEAATFDGDGTCLTSPNIWYCYTATESGDATITLCGSDYDTKMAVYDGCSCDPLGAELGCNDDSDCDFKDLQSTVVTPVIAGNSYLVEVGGYSSNTGPGVLSIWVSEECVVECPPGSTPEGEPCIGDNEEDVTNGGCNSVPPVWGSIGCGETVCAEVSTYLYGSDNYRDTDWYEFTLDNWYDVTLTFCGGFPFVAGFLEQIVPGSNECDNFTGYIAPYATGDECDTATLTITLGPGDYAIFSGPSVYEGLDCASGPHVYWMSLECVPAVPTYCEASGGCDEYIENVTVGEINNTTGCDNYGDYTALCATMEAGGSYPISITVNGGYSSDTGAVYVDWNQDMDFDDPGEMASLNPGAGYGPYSGTIDVPMDAEPGTTRMRVRLAYSTTPGPCGVYSWGEVEDYCISLGEPPLTWMAVPDTIYTAVKFSINPVDGYIYLTSEAAGVDVNTMTNVGMNLDGCALAVTTEVVAAPYPLTGDALKVTYDQKDFVLCEEVRQGGLVWDWVESFFDVTYDEGGPFTGSIDMRGHVSGDLNLDGSVDVADVTFMVAYLFTGGPAPLVIEAADVDASGDTPNVADLTRLVGYLFSGGDEPAHQ